MSRGIPGKDGVRPRDTRDLGEGLGGPGDDRSSRAWPARRLRASIEPLSGPWISDRGLCRFSFFLTLRVRLFHVLRRKMRGHIGVRLIQSNGVCFRGTGRIGRKLDRTDASRIARRSAKTADLSRPVGGMAAACFESESAYRFASSFFRSKAHF
jgi:hypothetical protein